MRIFVELFGLRIELGQAEKVDHEFIGGRSVQMWTEEHKQARADAKKQEAARVAAAEAELAELAQARDRWSNQSADLAIRLTEMKAQLDAARRNPVVLFDAAASN